MFISIRNLVNKSKKKKPNSQKNDRINTKIIFEQNRRKNNTGIVEKLREIVTHEKFGEESVMKKIANR